MAVLRKHAEASASGAVRTALPSVLPQVSTTVTALALVVFALTASAAPSADNILRPSVVEIKGNTSEWRMLLVDSLAIKNTTVRLAPNVDMDLSGLESIRVEAGVTLTTEHPVKPTIKRSAGNRRPEQLPPRPVAMVPERTAQKLGPRLYTRTRPVPLFAIVGDNVRFSGFRIQGPHYDTEEGDDNLERGIQIESALGVEITNMELSGWSGQAIYVQDAGDRQFNPSAVKIHDNFFHNNQHKGGNGYGVDVSAGAYAAIERNVFDFNRHAIAASGKAGTGYRAAQNLVLKGGGVHGKWYNQRTHLFDVHGDANCPDIPGNRHTWNCGNAGDQFWYQYNAFQYTADNSIKLRGTPRVAAYIDHNVFARKNDAIALRSNTRVHVGPNTTGVDTFGRYGVCDFDGDGKDDLFLPTGVTWWYSSGGKMHWWFMNAASELINQVGLGDFDGDGRCDVFAVHGDQWVISSGGTTQWRSLGTYGVPLDQLHFGRFDSDRITDVFRRAPNGQWSVVTPGKQDWRVLGSSSFPLSQLRFGDFTGDGITDVLGISGGRWSISTSGTQTWSPINSLSTSLASVLIADVNGNGTDDIVRLRPTGITIGRWEVSWEGRSGWQTLRSVGWEGSVTSLPRLYPFAGRFDGSAGADLLLVDSSRLGRLYSRAANTLATLNLYAY